MNFEKTLNGILKYMNAEIFTTLNSWQEVLARIAISRMIGNSANLKHTLINNPYIKTFAIMDEEGNVDVDGVMKDLKSQIEAKGKITIDLPMFGTFSFTANDVDKLHRAILEA